SASGRATLGNPWRGVAALRSCAERRSRAQDLQLAEFLGMTSRPSAEQSHPEQLRDPASLHGARTSLPGQVCPMAQRDIHLRSSDQRFVIKTRLGGGGMGEVFLAEDRELKRRVAMKAIRPEHSQDAEFRRRLHREAEQASQLDDERIARIYDIAEHDGQLFVIMEYVEGQTLRAKLSEPLAMEAFFSIADHCLAD